jgi:hypothetical protein
LLGVGCLALFSFFFAVVSPLPFSSLMGVNLS